VVSSRSIEQACLRNVQFIAISGYRHDLHIYINALGLPIVGDGIYPVLTPEGQVDYARPLQLLAKSIEFVDPLSGVLRQFESQRALQALT
jgi:tRNA pseudouridine32 synthase / 23S rRNA pseudouridine746 synthase